MLAYYLWSSLQAMKFYKYRRLDDHTEAIFTRYEMYFLRPAEFNDPFDCRIPVSFSGGTENDYRNLLKGTLSTSLKRKGLVLTSEHINFLINQGLSDKSHGNLVQGLQDGLSHEILNNHGIFCMSEKNDDILMWSHYANNHRGFCLEFPNSDVFQMARPVIYADTYPRVNFFEKSMEEIRNDVLLTKSTNWAYEKEWGILQRDITPGVYCFRKPGFLTGVIFGLLMPEKDRQKIREWARQGEHEVEFYEAQRTEGAFALQIVPIS